jgi:hypothetical protein
MLSNDENPFVFLLKSQNIQKRLQSQGNESLAPDVLPYSLTALPRARSSSRGLAILLFPKEGTA